MIDLIVLGQKHLQRMVVVALVLQVKPKEMKRFAQLEAKNHQKKSCLKFSLHRVSKPTEAR